MQVQGTAADEQAWIRDTLAAPVTHARWRVWRYAAPAIVLGLSQRAQQSAVVERIGDPLPVLVRASGGGAVLAGPWLIGVTVVLPPGHRLSAGPLVDSYRWFGELHAEVLRGFGVVSRPLPPQALREADDRVAGFAPLRWACFGALSPWELVDAGGRKLCGLAQQRRSTANALVAGTLSWRPPWSVLCDALDRTRDLDALTHRTTDCEALAAAGGARRLGEGGRETFASALSDRLDRALSRVFADDAGPDGSDAKPQSRSAASASRTASGSGSACAT